jgi:ferredoxin-type protein NapH
MAQDSKPREVLVVKVKALPGRQRWRTALLFIALLLFPITLFYLSPYIIVVGAAEGIVNGSFIVFSVMFIAAIFLGRLWCGWLCPGAALQEFAFPIRNRLFGPKWLRWIKWAIWIPWISLIVWLAIQAGGYRQIKPFHHLEGGLTVEQPYWYLVYYVVLIAFLGLALIFGRRGGCHTICWMAPFMILGRKVRNALKTPALHLTADTDACIHCKKCTQACPMSLDVHGMVQSPSMENSDCVLCGSCVDTCPKDVIHYAFDRQV